ncbi:hypothetical protein LTS10_010707 [Elasticomyces elasticus]|nr:hypothetical protein LTS10_010707 [Elasticomyces elasticus]
MESNTFTGSNYGGIQGGNIHIGGNVNFCSGETSAHKSDTSVNYGMYTANSVPPTEHTDECTDCLRSLSYRGMSSEITRDPPAPDTCNWIFYDQQYISWAKAGGTFSIVGRAGCGKSTLMQHIFKLEISLREMAVEIGRYEPYPQLEILCFCFRGTQEEPELDMLRSLLHQMLCDNPDLLARFVAISGFERRCRNRGDHGSKWDWTISELRDYFASLVKYARQGHHVIRIFLDGVDERVADVCRRLAGSIPAKSDPVHGAVGICYSCRPSCYLDIRFEFKINLEALNATDIAVYVHDQFMTRTRSGQITRGQAEIIPIMEALIKRTTSCFQWVVFVCPGVLRLAMSSETVDAVVSSIRGFSQELAAVYAHQLTGIPTRDVPHALSVFQWLLHGKVVFSAPVLRDAVCLVDGRPYRSPEDIKDSAYWCDDANVYADRVVRLSRGLVVGGRLKFVLDDQTTRNVQVLIFDHDSVSEFMLEAGLQMLEERLPRHLAGIPHDKLESSIAGKCLSYLISSRLSESVSIDTAMGRAHDRDIDDDVSSFSSFDEDLDSTIGFDRLIPSSFELYAEECWRQHLAAAEASNDFTGIVNVLDRPNFSDWQAVMSKQYETNATLLHILCAGRHERTLSQILGVQRDSSENEALYGRLRKQFRSELDSQMAEGMTPMALAANFGRHGAIEVLVEHGADPNLSDDEGWTPLHRAADQGHDQVVRALLSCRAVNVDARSKAGIVPLDRAVFADNLTTSDLLLRASSFGAHCEEVSKDENGHHSVHTPLLSAFRWGSKAMLTLLLTCSKIDKGLQGLRRGSLLHYLIFIHFYEDQDDYKDKLDMLIHSGKLDLNAEDNDGRTVMFYACMYNDAHAVHSLLSNKKVDLGTRDRLGQTAIEVAIQWNHADIVKLFIEAKAGLRIKCDHDHDQGMALLARAADLGHADIVELLLSSSEVDIRAWDDTKSTALARAVERGRTACVKLLLKADGVCCRDCCGRTLLTAVDGGYLDLVQTLVRATSDEFGPETVDIMLQHGIVVGSGTGPWSTSVLENVDEGRLRPDGSTDDLAARQQITQYLEKYVSNVRAVYLG